MHLKLAGPLLAAALGVASILSPLTALADSLRIAMTASDIPTLDGWPLNNGAEGLRFAGYTIYDGLVNWDLSATDHIAGIVPGLATEWHVDPDNNMRWLFKIRKGVKFHDGSLLTTDAVVWNFNRMYDPKSPQYNAHAALGIGGWPLPVYKSIEKVDDDWVAINTSVPWSLFPNQLVYFLIVSPAEYDASGKDWTEFARHPSGTGPYKFKALDPGVSFTVTRNDDYWDKGRISAIQDIQFFPMPDPATRLAALRSDEVDWIEVPPADAIDSLKAAGFQISRGVYPHIWPYYLDARPESPFHDVRVRQALNYAIDRDGIVKLLNGMAMPSVSMYPPGNTLYGAPTQHYNYDPQKAKELLAEAGYDDKNPLRFKVLTSTGGSGQMAPVPMNALIQQYLKDIGVQMEIQAVDWGTVVVATQNAPGTPQTFGAQALNSSTGFDEPSNSVQLFTSPMFSPNGRDWGHYKNDKVDALLKEAMTTFDASARDKLMAEAQSIITDDAPWLYVVHDVNPRALSPKLEPFTPPQAWFVDLTKVKFKP